MTLPVFLAAFVAIPLILSLLDLAQRRRARRQQGREGPSSGALLLLFVVFLTYSALQYGGLALAPRAEAMTEQVRDSLDRWTGRPEAGQTTRGPLHAALVAASVVLLFYLGGLWDYLLHRFVSHSRLLWFTHEYHHLPSQIFVLIPGISARPFAVVSTFPVIAATVVTACGLSALFGLPAWDLAPLQILLLIQVFVLTSSHSCCLRDWGWFHRALSRLAVTTPQEHVLHHAVDLRGNYGNFTTLWDRLFGTYLDPERPENQGHACGLPYDQDFLGAITLGAVKIPDGLRRRLEVGRYCNIRPLAPLKEGGLSDPAIAHRAAPSRPADGVHDPDRQPEAERQDR
jgi:sterol desaturase/sphingolipid hydroxylase (fatty acid hydroxylase superfamily)